MQYEKEKLEKCTKKLEAERDNAITEKDAISEEKRKLESSQTESSEQHKKYESRIQQAETERDEAVTSCKKV